MRALGLGCGLVLGLAASSVTAIAAQADGPDARFLKSLERLDPSARLEQLCDYTAMTRIRADDKTFRPDRAVANAMADALVNQDTMQAKAGAFRSRGKWYTLTYTCTATPDHLKVIAFKYSVGPEIPPTKWAGYGLWQ